MKKKIKGWLCRDKKPGNGEEIAFFTDPMRGPLLQGAMWVEGNYRTQCSLLEHWTRCDFKKRYPNIPLPRKGTKRLVELAL